MPNFPISLSLLFFPCLLILFLFSPMSCFYLKPPFLNWSSNIFLKHKRNLYKEFQREKTQIDWSNVISKTNVTTQDINRKVRWSYSILISDLKPFDMINIYSGPIISYALWVFWHLYQQIFLMWLICLKKWSILFYWGIVDLLY